MSKYGESMNFSSQYFVSIQHSLSQKFFVGTNSTDAWRTTQSLFVIKFINREGSRKKRKERNLRSQELFSSIWEFSTIFRFSYFPSYLAFFLSLHRCRFSCASLSFFAITQKILNLFSTAMFPSDFYHFNTHRMSAVNWILQFLKRWSV